MFSYDSKISNSNYSGISDLYSCIYRMEYKKNLFNILEYLACRRLSISICLLYIIKYISD